jgi:hypothetical protein
MLILDVKLKSDMSLISEASAFKRRRVRRSGIDEVGLIGSSVPPDALSLPQDASSLPLIDRFKNAATGSIAYHGNYVGPGWSAGKFQNSVVSNVPPIDDFDASAKKHDERYASGYERSKADMDFAKENIGRGIKRTAAGLAVGAQGVIRKTVTSITPSNRATSNLRGAMSVRRRIRTTDDDAMDTEDPPKPEALTAAAAAIPATTKGRQTEITNPPKRIKYGLPEYFTTKLKLNYRYNVTNLGGNTPNVTTDNAADLELRLESIYDVNATEASQQQPQWRDYWANIYDYYTVLGVEYHITIVSEGNEPLMICENTYGADEPASFAVTHWALGEDPNMTKHYMPKTLTSGVPVVYTIHGHKDHNDYRRDITEIKQDSNDQIWTAVGSDPALSYRLKIMPRFFDDNYVPADGVEVYMAYHIDMTFTVQFKEAKVAYKFAGQD